MILLLVTGCFPLYGLHMYYITQYTLSTASHLAILYACRSNQRKSLGVSSAGIVIFTNCHDWRIKLLISDMTDIGK